MLNLEDDITAVFFGTDFAARFTRVRVGVDDAEISGIFGVTDGQALDRHAHAATRTLHTPATADVQRDDMLVCLEHLPEQGVPLGAQFKVLETPRRVNDGGEMTAKLGSLKP